MLNIKGEIKVTTATGRRYTNKIVAELATTGEAISASHILENGVEENVLILQGNSSLSPTTAIVIINKGAATCKIRLSEIIPTNSQIILLPAGCVYFLYGSKIFLDDVEREVVTVSALYEDLPEIEESGSGSASTVEYEKGILETIVVY